MTMTWLRAPAVFAMRLFLWLVFSFPLGACSTHADHGSSRPSASGFEASEPETPTWCGAYDGWAEHMALADLDVASHRYQLAMEHATEARDFLGAAQIAAAAACEGPIDRHRRAWTVRAMDRWSKRTKMSERSTRALFAELASRKDAVEHAMASACKQGPLVSALLCDVPERPAVTEIDRLDLLGQLTDRDRLRYLAGCSGAHCLRDDRSVDWSRAVELVRAETQSEILVQMAQSALAKIHAHHQKSLSRPQAAELLAAEDRWKAEIFDAEPALVAEVAEIIGSTVNGERIPECSRHLRARVQERLRAAPPTVREPGGLSDPLTALLFRGLTLCDRSDSILAQHRAHRLRDLPPILGPRSMVALAAGRKLAPLPPVPEGAYDLPRVGKVARVDPQSNGRVTVHFEGRTREQPTDRCRDVAQLRHGSMVTHVERCRTIGSQKIRVVPAPVTLEQAVANHLRTGDTISFAVDRAWNTDSTRYVNGKRQESGGSTHEATLLYARDYWLGLDLAS